MSTVMEIWNQFRKKNSCRFVRRVYPNFLFLGDYTLNSYEITEQNSTILNVDLHEDYSSPTIHKNDVALITLSRPIRFNTHTSPICLPKNNGNFKVNRTCYVTGKIFFN